MARKGRIDRGLKPRTNADGKTVWYVRLQHQGKEHTFGSFPPRRPRDISMIDPSSNNESNDSFPSNTNNGASRRWPASSRPMSQPWTAAVRSRSR